MIKSTLKRIDLGSAKLKFRIIIATIFFSCALGYFFCLREIYEKKENAYLNVQSIRKELNRQLKIATGYADFFKKIKQLTSLFDVDSNEFNDKHILHTINGTLFFSFSEATEINSLVIKNKVFFSTLQVEGRLSSSNNTIINFLRQIVRLKHLIVIEDFRWTFLGSESKSQHQEGFFSFKVYIPQVNNEKANSVIPGGNNLFIHAVSGKDELIKYALNKIKMVGFLSAGPNQHWGFVVLPNKKIFKVKLGDQLGLEKGLVIGAYAQEIFIWNPSLNKIIKLSIDKDRKTHVKHIK